MLAKCARHWFPLAILASLLLVVPDMRAQESVSLADASLEDLMNVKVSTASKYLQFAKEAPAFAESSIRLGSASMSNRRWVSRGPALLSIRRDWMAFVLRFAPRIFAMALLFCSPGVAMAQSENASEYELKAAVLYNFARFVEWNPVKVDSDMLFCIASEDGVAKQVEKTLVGRKLGSRKVKVQQLSGRADVTQCSLIFVTQSSPKEFRSAASQVSDREILTVSETRESPSGGAIINFYRDNERVRFEIAVASAERAGVKLSSKLMSLGKVVGGKVSGSNEEFSGLANPAKIEPVGDGYGKRRIASCLRHVGGCRRIRGTGGPG